jgi:hypothetical protein
VLMVMIPRQWAASGGGLAQSPEAAQGIIWGERKPYTCVLFSLIKPPVFNYWPTL